MFPAAELELLYACGDDNVASLLRWYSHSLFVAKFTNLPLAGWYSVVNVVGLLHGLDDPVVEDGQGHYRQDACKVKSGGQKIIHWRSFTNFFVECNISYLLFTKEDDEISFCFTFRISYEYFAKYAITMLKKNCDLPTVTWPCRIQSFVEYYSQRNFANCWTNFVKFRISRDHSTNLFRDNLN
jgi:hypothetical protein